MKLNTIHKSLAVLGTVISIASITPASGQYVATPAAPEAGRPVVLPKSGPVTIDPAIEARMRAQVRVPEGFNLTLFAGAPIALYPTCVAEGADGAIYVCVD